VQDFEKWYVKLLAWISG